LKEPFDPVYRVKSPIAPATDYSYPACGLYLPRSSIIIRAGFEYRLPKNEFINLKHDIDFSINTFAHVLNYNNVDEAIDTNRKKLCFKKAVLWPCMYNLRMLAHSYGWRDEKNVSLLADSLNHLFSFSQSGEMVYTYKKGQFIGPAFAFINQQMQILGFMKDEAVGTTLLDMMELFARCGIVKQVTLLKNKYESLLELIDVNLNMKFNIDKQKDYGWSPYFGIALEENWQTNNKILCDILFRILLTIYYVECT
jgi:hypothetical protein